MFFSPFYVVLLVSFVDLTAGSLSLLINKKTDDIFYPVSSNVEENIGTTFSLVCELVSTTNDSQFDDNLAWLRGQDNRRVKIASQTEINKSEKEFAPLLSNDKGKYFCISRKFNLMRGVEVLVRSEVKREPKPLRETIYCSEHMFQCMSNGLCISQHYVCDGKLDCKDGSDESMARCNGDPCRDKIPCDDGRCIPSAWCCDRHHDPNCTVTNRLRCCQGLSDSYEEMELGFPTVSQTHHTTRYFFILVCVVSILFSVILLLLIISKVILFAKKAALQQQSRVCENIALRNQTNINVIPFGHLFTTLGGSRPDGRGRNVVRNIIIDSSDVNDPLLFNPARFNVINSSNSFDQPPSYGDVLRNNRMVLEPPPPYESMESLNTSGPTFQLATSLHIEEAATEDAQ